MQVLNRVAWDNIISLVDQTELGWKDTVRINPLQDTTVALRPIIPELPWELPNAVRNLNPMMPTGSTQFFNNIDPQGNPLVTPITNQLVNFGWEYVYHCHILTHEEMDMMRPVSVAMPPVKPDTLAFDKLDSDAVLERQLDRRDGVRGAAVNRWRDSRGPTSAPTRRRSTSRTPPARMRSLADPTYDPFTDYQYRVVAKNTVGYLDGAGPAGFQEMTVQSVSDPLTVLNPPAAPTNLTAAMQAGPQVLLNWTDDRHQRDQLCRRSAATTAGRSVTITITVGRRRRQLHRHGGHRHHDAMTTACMPSNAVGDSAFSNIATVNLRAGGSDAT